MVWYSCWLFDLRIFGYPAYAHVDNGNLKPRSVKCIFKGYKPGIKGYKLWCPESRKVIISRDVVLDETVMLPALSESSALPLDDLSDMNQQKSFTHVELQIGVESIPVPISQSSPKIQSGTIYSSPLVMPQYSITKDSLRRDIRPPQKYAEVDLVAYVLNVAEGIDSSEEPSSYSEAEKMQSLYKNGIWDLVRLPKDKKVVRCKWIFKMKEGTSGVKYARYKARLVAKGYSQVPAKVMKEILKVKAQLSKDFEMKDLGAVKKILGMEIMSAVGSLMYVMVCSRPDLSYAISAVCRYMFEENRDGVIGYVDSDFAGDHDKRRSLTRNVFIIGGCAIS
ncbi:hypothetical protein FXO37_32427 [Capsicum annuum]|nr:hypothetical protein FXO37_32427 [Capsicum annuum]